VSTPEAFNEMLCRVLGPVHDKMRKAENMLVDTVMLTSRYPRLYSYTRVLDVGPGWLPLIEELSAKLEPLCNDEVFAVQVKEKYGTLRFYMSCYTSEVERMIEDAEHRSQFICMGCGEPGQLRGGGWIETLCDECNKEKGC
jgi:hypothetical protein